MEIALPDFEPRLQRRYQQLVKQHLHTSEKNAAGARPLPSLNDAFASTQAAWRYYSNDAVSLAGLAAPLLEQARRHLPNACRDFALVLHDWSDLPYTAHTSKPDRKKMGKQLGYELAAALLISDRTGDPIAPLSLSLWASDGWHTSHDQSLRTDLSPLGLITETMDWLDRQDWALKLVHIIDREGDSVFHYRQWQSANHLFVVRANARQRVVWGGRTRLLREVAAEVELSASNEVELSAKVIGQIFVGQSQLVIDRPAFGRARQGKRRWVKGEAIKLRLIVCQLRLPDETLLAEWYLLSNVEQKVSGEHLAHWYYWRWRIESYFKLLKSHGFQIEQWKQTNAEAIAKRLMVAAMACVVVWQLQRANDEEAVLMREMLIRLSGRQVRRGQVTAPALLAGLWTFLAAIELLDHYELDDLKRMARIAVPGYT